MEDENKTEDGVYNDFKIQNHLTETHLEKIKEIVNSGSVKRHLFRESKREIWTVVGNNGDMLVLPGRLYCSCRDYYFRVLSGKTPKCYHLLAKDLAERVGTYETLEIADEEYQQFANFLLLDIINATQTR
jgi:predicted nucleic acid-binding Zn finger protein